MLLRLPSTNFKLICGKLVSNPTEIINVMIVSFMSFFVSNNVLDAQSHMTAHC